MHKALEIALSYYGEAEIKGSKHNPKILEFFKDSGHGWVKDDETAYCAAFIGSNLHDAGMKGTGKLNARSYLDYGTPVTEPKVGDLAIFWRGSKDSWTGHVAWFISEIGDKVFVYGANQKDSINIMPYPKERLLGYRRLPESSKMMSINPKRLTDAEAITLLLLGIKHFKKN